MFSVDKIILSIKLTIKRTFSLFIEMTWPDMGDNKKNVPIPL